VSFWAGALALGAGCFWLWRKRRSREAALEADDQEQPVEQVV
jgi:LPXTG-motif cell wall-anchored protein